MSIETEKIFLKRISRLFVLLIIKKISTFYIYAGLLLLKLVQDFFLNSQFFAKAKRNMTFKVRTHIVHSFLFLIIYIMVNKKKRRHPKMPPFVLFYFRTLFSHRKNEKEKGQ